MPTQVVIGLLSRDGDRLGHLVRGVQMLRSYGHEFEAETYSPVFDVGVREHEPPVLCATIGGQSDASAERWQGMIRETLWALGHSGSKLGFHVVLVRYGYLQNDATPMPLQAVLEGWPQGVQPYLSALEFSRLCDWGQAVIGGHEGVIGEWPDATAGTGE